MEVGYYGNETLLAPKQFVEGLGRMFYIINPKNSAIEDVEDVPNFYVQSWPYFFMFMVLEHIILKLEGKKGIRLNDGITSLSNGMFLEEVHVLWAQHQVHHTSEDFNMGVGIRQSILQGWCGFTFYTKYVIQRFKEYDNWVHKLRAVFSRPSWKPGHSVRFKDMEEDPALHTRVKYDVILPQWCTAYLLMHYGFILYGFHQLFLMHLAMPTTTVSILVVYILLSLTVFGMILDASPKAPLLETIRCFATVIITRWLTILNPMVQVLYILSGLFWFLFVYNTVEIKATKYVD
ncbi:hypothetical protein MSG28_002636 [Choristoneura fumiferana]|uniref:Uncharacterized protein n=1 Tax=Choristoneura fumiferana TaxID=7141 RepID=A0ACC0JIJ3_CHOFU|nr:hypothetical protein MSG28_002636 [Choristoneura fumiferana]